MAKKFEELAKDPYHRINYLLKHETAFNDVFTNTRKNGLHCKVCQLKLNFRDV